MKCRVAVCVLFATMLMPSLSPRAGGDPRALVICAPGFPGTTEQAQPTMDVLAVGLEQTAGWSDGSLRAIYFPTLEPGLKRLQDEDVALALVPLPFYLRYGAGIDLQPMLTVVHSAAREETWSLVARRGALGSASDLSDWEVASGVGYAPGFVRHIAVGEWGPLPAQTEIRFTARPLSSLRKAAAGDKVAVLLDAAQSQALPALPFAADLEVVARSESMPASVLCRVGQRLDEAEVEALAAPLVALHETEGGRALLESIRVERFQPLPAGFSDRVRRMRSSLEPEGGEEGR